MGNVAIFSVFLLFSLFFVYKILKKEEKYVKMKAGGLKCMYSNVVESYL